MSSASNMGYGGTSPYSGINTNMVNSTNSNYSGGLGSTQIPSSAYSMRGASNNVDAAAGRLRGGGKGTKYYKLIKRKIKNITKRYKMRGKSNRRRITRMKRKIRSSSKRTRTRSRRHMRGGSYQQFGSNVAQSANFSVGGVLNAGSLGMANPPPIQLNPPSCQDNANHFKLGR